jgi:hypothetical protein
MRLNPLVIVIIIIQLNAWNRVKEGEHTTQSELVKTPKKEGPGVTTLSAWLQGRCLS